MQHPAGGRTAGKAPPNGPSHPSEVLQPVRAARDKPSLQVARPRPVPRYALLGYRLADTMQERALFQRSGNGLCGFIQVSMILYCVRHGESTHNAQGRVQGQSDVALSDLGRRQAEAISQVLANEPVELVYSSPLRRAMETARIIAQAVGVEVRTDPRLQEIHAGIFQDKLRSEIHRLYPEEIAQWHSEDPNYVIPGGESRNQLLKRSLAAFGAIVQSGYQHVVVVSHGRLLVTTVKSLLGIPSTSPPYSLQNGSITTLSLQDGQAGLIAMDCIDHLRDVGVSGKGDL